MSFAALARLSIAISAAFLFAIAPAKADFVISVGNGKGKIGPDGTMLFEIDPDGTFLLEIGIASDSPPQDLSDFELILEITPLSAAAGSSLQFVNPQSELFLADADYIFAASSESIADGIPAVTSNTGDAIVFVDVSSDAAGDFLDVPVTSGHLLATVDLRHVLGSASAAATAGNQYNVTVALESVFFQASGFDPEYTSTIGTVTVGAVAIPEPTSVAMLMFASCGLVLQRRRRQS